MSAPESGHKPKPMGKLSCSNDDADVGLVSPAEAQTVTNKRELPTQHEVATRRNLRKRTIDDSEAEVSSNKRGRKSRNGNKPFSCDICKATHVVKQARAKGQVCEEVGAISVKRSPTPRYKKDPQTGKILTLCNACGLKFNRPKKEPVVFDKESRQRFLSDSKHFVQSLVNALKDAEAVCLCCTNVHKTTGACCCVQKFLLDDHSNEVNQERARDLLQLSKEAQQLAAEKRHSQTKKGCIGLGNGQKRSANYEIFIQQQRRRLREDLRLCEKATQKILHYSNNYLYKKLKTVEGKCRIQRTHGKHVMGRLKPIAELAEQKCCSNKCVELASLQPKVVDDWRYRYGRGEQSECRLVVSEMLTQNGSSYTNCTQFIQMVTGCSPSIAKTVQEEIEKTGGVWTPKPHQLANSRLRSRKRLSEEVVVEVGDPQSHQATNPTLSETRTPTVEVSACDVHELVPVVQSLDGVSMAIQHLLSSDTFPSSQTLPSISLPSNDTELVGLPMLIAQSQYLGPAAMELFAAQAANCVHQEQNFEVARGDASQSTTNTPQANSSPHQEVASARKTSTAQSSDEMMVLGPLSLHQTAQLDSCGMKTVQPLCQAASETPVDALETLVALAGITYTTNLTSCQDAAENSQSQEVSWFEYLTPQ